MGHIKVHNDDIKLDNPVKVNNKIILEEKNLADEEQNARNLKQVELPKIKASGERLSTNFNIRATFEGSEMGTERK